MKNKFLILPLLMAVVLLVCRCSDERLANPVADIKALLVSQQDSLSVDVKSLSEAVERGDSVAVKMAFLKTRKAYKKLEWFAEYYAPGVSREINGPPLPEIETEETKFAEPSGLQVIEELIYPWQVERLGELKRELASLESSVARLKSLVAETELTDSRILDACKLEMFRVQITGITGFDTPICFAGIDEAAASVAAVSIVLDHFGENPPLQSALSRAVNYLRQHPDFDQFDRMTFIKVFANPVTRGIVKWQSALKIKPLAHEQAIGHKVSSLFDKDMFNVGHFVNSAEGMPSPEKQALGKQLFSDPVVSGATQTCISCHNPKLAFTDGLPKSLALKPGQFLKRNAPTLMYAGLQNSQFYDMRFQTLENQAMDVISNKEEMHGSVEAAALRMQKDEKYYQKFKQAFPSMEKELKPRFVMIALASYVRSLNPFNSRLDEYMRGDSSKLSQGEVEGFNLFMGKAKCATCHFMPLFNGTAGPAFSNTEGEVIGVLEDPKARPAKLDPDQGRYFWNKMDQLKFAFKTPTLRNVARTAPYMHNGAYQTLEQVMDLYNAGGAAGMGIDLPNQTLSPDSLHLSDQEISKVIAFLKTLNDRD